MTNINGTKVWDMQQTPFGITTVNNDADGNGTAVKNNFRFPGQYFDAETGLNYNYFRTYDATIGRYTQSDPIGLNGGLNVFGYVGGRVIGAVDVWGLRFIIAVVWESKAIHKSVGHVLLTEIDGGVILSNFPQPPRRHGKNIQKSFEDTITAEARTPSGIYKVWIYDDVMFDQAVKTETNIEWWDWNPDISLRETNCTVASYNALIRGGVEIATPWFRPWTPDDFFDAIEQLAVDNDKINIITTYPWKVQK
ncbi:MAG: RHS repeat-associated core domain-containing protein [Mariprofundales bacterium]